MSIFADYAPKYYEAGINVVPIEPKSKRCLIPEHNRLSTHKLKPKEYGDWLDRFADYNIGLHLGPYNGVMLLDFDYDGPQADHYIRAIKEITGEPVCARLGKKGFGAFFKFNKISGSKTCKKNGAIFCELLSEGRYTVIPPSIHPETNKEYQWIGGYSFIDAFNDDQFTELTQDMWDKICLLAKTDITQVTKTKFEVLGRNNFLFTYALKIIERCQDINEFCQEIKKKDEIEFGDDAYFKDEREHRGRHSSSWDAAKTFGMHVYNWYKRHKKDAGFDWDFGKSSEEISNKDAYFSFFDSLYPEVKKDIMSGITYFYDARSAKGPIKTRQWKPVENQIKSIKALAMENYLKKSNVEEYFSLWIDEIRPQFMFNIPDWDGQHRASGLFNCLKLKNIPQRLGVELCYDWFLNMFRRIYDNSVQNRLLVLKGSQGIGKDVFIDSLFSLFEDNFGNISLSDNEKTNFEVVRSLCVANIPEFDRSSRLLASTVKDLITRNKANFREAYARKEDSFLLRTSYISSCNVENILRDPTGSRRFIILDLESIDWSYSKLDIVQVMAELHNKALNTDWRASSEAENALKNYLEVMQPDDPDDDLIESYNIKMSSFFDKKQMDKVYFSLNDSIRSILDILLRESNYRNVSQVKDLLKRRGYKHQDHRGIYYTYDSINKPYIIEQKDDD